MAESNGRRIGVAVDFSECSKKALNWAIENVARDGDYLILITVAHDMHYEDGEMQLWETVGSRTVSQTSFLVCFTLNFFFKKPSSYDRSRFRSFVKSTWFSLLSDLSKISVLTFTHASFCLIS